MKKSLLVLGLSFSLVSFASSKADLSKSQVKWEGSKVVGGSHWGHVKVKDANLVLGKDGVPSSGKIVVDLKTIDVKDIQGEKAASLKGHLESGDFFEVAKYPEATFVAKKITPVASANKPLGSAEYQVEGDLTIKGKTNKETFKVNVDNTSDKVTKVNGDLVFDRTKYGVMYNSGKLTDTVKDKIIKDEVKLNLDLVFNK